MAASKRPQGKSRGRRDNENELIGQLSALLPLDKALDVKLDKLSVLRMTLAFLKCRKSLETDNRDVRDCLAEDSNYKQTSVRNSPVPLAMLDNDGNLVAGTLANRALTVRSTDICLSDSVLSSLEQTFLNPASETSENVPIDVEERYEKLKKYKEGLERGMREFLCQEPASVSSEDSSTSQSAKEGKPKKVDNHNSLPSPTKNDISCDSSVTTVAPRGFQTKDVADVTNELLSHIDLANESLLMLKAVPGFFLMLDRNKKVLFVSENITEILGISQINLIGHDISQVIYDKDYPELEKQMCDEQFLEDKDKGVAENVLHRTFYLAMNYCFQKTRTRRKNSGQKLFRWDAKLRLYRDKSTQEIKVKSLFSLCRPVRDDVIAEFQKCEVVFFTRHGMDYKCIYCDPRVQEIMGYSPSSILGTDGFSLKHPCDVMMCHYKHKTLAARGHGDSGYYRLLTRSGRWVWAISLYTVIFDNDGQPTHVNVQTYIVSMEEAKCVLAREKEDYQRMKNEGFDFDLTYYGLSQPTLATLAAKRTLKRKQFSDNGIQLKKHHVHNHENGKPERDLLLTSAPLLECKSMPTPSNVANKQLYQLSPSQPLVCNENCIEQSPDCLLVSKSSSIYENAEDQRSALENRTIVEASTTQINYDLEKRKTVEIYTDSSSSFDSALSQDIISTFGHCTATLDSCNSHNFESQNLSSPFENCLADLESNNPTSCASSLNATFPSVNCTALIDSNSSHYSIQSQNITILFGNRTTVLDSNTSFVSGQSQDVTSSFVNCAPNTSEASVSDETTSFQTQDENDNNNVSQSESSISQQLTDSPMGDIDVNYSPLPSVDLDSPNIDIDLLMSDVPDCEINNESFQSTEPQTVCSSSREEDFEVQSILKYFLPDQREVAVTEISHRSDKYVLSDSQRTVTEGGSRCSRQPHSPDNIRSSDLVSLSNTGSTHVKQTKTGMSESEPSAMILSVSQKSEQMQGITELDLNDAHTPLQCSSHDDIRMNSASIDISPSSQSSCSSRHLPDLDFTDSCLLLYLDQDEKGIDTSLASDLIDLKSNQLSCYSYGSSLDLVCTTGLSQLMESQPLDVISEDSISTDLLDWIQQDESLDVGQRVQTSHLSLSYLRQPRNPVRNVFPYDCKETSIPDCTPHINTSSKWDQEIIDYFSTASNTNPCIDTHFTSSSDTDYFSTASNTNLCMGSHFTTSGDTLLKSSLSLDGQIFDNTFTDAGLTEPYNKATGIKSPNLNGELHSLADDLNNLNDLPEILRELCGYLE